MQSLISSTLLSACLVVTYSITADAFCVQLNCSVFQIFDTLFHLRHIDLKAALLPNGSFQVMVSYGFTFGGHCGCSVCCIIAVGGFLVHSDRSCVFKAVVRRVMHLPYDCFSPLRFSPHHASVRCFAFRRHDFLEWRRLLYLLCSVTLYLDIFPFARPP